MSTTVSPFPTGRCANGEVKSQKSKVTELCRKAYGIATLKAQPLVEKCELRLRIPMQKFLTIAWIQTEKLSCMSQSLAATPSLQDVTESIISHQATSIVTNPPWNLTYLNQYLVIVF